MLWQYLIVLIRVWAYQSFQCCLLGFLLVDLLDISPKSQNLTLPIIAYRWINANQLTGTIPTELSALTGLSYLSLFENELTSTIPAELAALTGLTRMLLWSNNITGTIPSELMALTGLTKMVVCDNIGLCGDVPAGLTLHSYSGYCATATTGTRLGSPCPSSSPSASPTNSPTSSAPTSSAPTSSPTGKNPV